MAAHQNQFLLINVRAINIIQMYLNNKAMHLWGEKEENDV